jgi:hypothetical protein
MEEVRLLALGEEASFIKLKQRALFDHPAIFLETKYKPLKEYVTAQITSGVIGTTKNVVLKVNDILLGMLQINIGTGKLRHQAILKNIFVIQTLITEHRGFSSKLIEFATVYAFKRGVDEVQIAVPKGHRLETKLQALGYSIKFEESKALKLYDDSYTDIVTWHKLNG